MKYYAEKFCGMRFSYYLCSVFNEERAAKDNEKGRD